MLIGGARRRVSRSRSADVKAGSPARVFQRAGVPAEGNLDTRQRSRRINAGAPRSVAHRANGSKLSGHRHLKRPGPECNCDRIMNAVRSRDLEVPNSVRVSRPTRRAHACHAHNRPPQFRPEGRRQPGRERPLSAHPLGASRRGLTRSASVRKPLSEWQQRVQDAYQTVVLIVQTPAH